MNWSKCLLVGLGVVWSSGCALRSPESRLAEAGVVPERWAATKQAEAGVDRRWVRAMGGRELEKWVGEAQAANPDLKVSAARVEQAAAVARIAGADRFPGIGLGGDLSRAKQAPMGPGGSAFQRTSFGVSLQAAWELDLWGRVRKGAEAAVADAEAQVAADRALRASLAAQVVRAWLALAEANEQVALAEVAVASREQSLTLIQERFERALAEEGGSAAQVRLAETELASGRAELERRKGEREQAVRQLELLLGRYPSGVMEAASKLPALPGVVPVGLPSELLLRRPDVLQAERQLAAAGRRKDAAVRALFPAIQLTGSLGTSSDALEGLLRSSNGVWSLGGSLAQPVFQAGRLTGEVDRLDGATREAGANLQRVVLAAFGEVEQSLVAEMAMRKQEVERKRAVELAEDSAKRAREEFEGGTGDVLTYLSAQAREIEARAAHVTLRRLILDQRVSLHLALGGDVMVHGPPH